VLRACVAPSAQRARDAAGPRSADHRARAAAARAPRRDDLAQLEELRGAEVGRAAQRLAVGRRRDALGDGRGDRLAPERLNGSGASGSRSARRSQKASSWWNCVARWIVNGTLEATISRSQASLCL
jgi:hypothetical protein